MSWQDINDLCFEFRGETNINEFLLAVFLRATSLIFEDNVVIPANKCEISRFKSCHGIILPPFDAKVCSWLHERVAQSDILLLLLRFCRGFRLGLVARQIESEVVCSDHAV